MGYAAMTGSSLLMKEGALGKAPGTECPEWQAQAIPDTTQICAVQCWECWCCWRRCDRQTDVSSEIAWNSEAQSTQHLLCQTEVPVQGVRRARSKASRSSSLRLPLSILQGRQSSRPSRPHILGLASRALPLLLSAFSFSASFFHWPVSIGTSRYLRLLCPTPAYLVASRGSVEDGFPSVAFHQSGYLPPR